MNAHMPPSPRVMNPDIVDLGCVAYDAAFQMQQELQEQVLAGTRPPVVLLLEHEPVVTVSRRARAADNLLASPERLKKLGVTVHATDRGGDITYHGPGQLVAYPILPLQSYHLNVRTYVRLLEQVVIDTLAKFGITGERDECAVGVWVEPGEGMPPAKIAAIGVRVRRWISMHGLALNVTTDLDHFKLIVPCGLQRPVTSMASLLGNACPSMVDVRQAMVEAIQQRLAEAAGSH